MKNIITMLLLSTALLNCTNKLSDKDRSLIDHAVVMHNATYSLTWLTDSNRHATDLYIANYNLYSDTVRAKHETDSAMEHYSDGLPKFGQPYYNACRDPYLTFDRFMDYCEKNKWESPVKHAKDMNELDEKYSRQ